MQPTFSGRPATCNRLCPRGGSRAPYLAQDFAFGARLSAHEAACDSRTVRSRPRRRWRTSSRQTFARAAQSRRAASPRTRNARGPFVQAGRVAPIWAALTALLLAGCGGSSHRRLVSTHTSTSSSISVPAVGIHKIRHVVVIMQENRSFDSYFGTYPGAD